MLLRWKIFNIVPAAAVSYSGRQRTQCEAFSPTPVNGDGIESRAELKLVQVVFRHGARTPLTDKYWAGAEWNVCKDKCKSVKLVIEDINGGPQPASEYDAKQRKTLLPGGCAKGQLTEVGQRQAREFGSWLRHRYIDRYQFLPSAYADNVLKGRTTNYQRTIGTLTGVISGLYPEAARVQREISAATSHEVDEVMIGNWDACRRLGQLMKVHRASEQEHRKALPEVKDLEARVRVAMNLKPEDPVQFVDLHDAMTTLQYHKKPIPKGMTPDLLLEVNKEATKRMTRICAPEPAGGPSDHIIRLSIGRLFEKIIQRMEEATDSDPKAKIYLYSGHDTTIMPMLVSLGQSVSAWPEYVSNVVFELWEAKDTLGSDGRPRHFVRVLCNREVAELPTSPPGTLHELVHFKEVFLAPYILSSEDHVQQCLIGFEHESSMPTMKKVGDSASAGM